MKLALKQSGSLEDWYLIEKAEHDGRIWMGRNEYGMCLMSSARISDADVEGTAEEMKGIAKAIRERGGASFGRCAVDATSEPVKFSSPRNSLKDGEVSLADADALASEIEAKLSPVDDTVARMRQVEI